MVGSLRSRRRWRRTAHAALVALVALAVTPIDSLAPRACRVCPVTCPMHARGEHAPKLGCHRQASADGGEAAGAARSHGHCAPAIGLTRPGCSGTHEDVTLSVGKAVLPAWSWSVRLTADDRLAIDDTHHALRAADPPESPPPIPSA